jgi:hypothetical protein
MQKKIYAPVPVNVEKIGKIVLDAAYKVHTALGRVCWNLFTRLVRRSR